MQHRFLYYSLHAFQDISELKRAGSFVETLRQTQYSVLTVAVKIILRCEMCRTAAICYQVDSQKNPLSKTRRL